MRQIAKVMKRESANHQWVMIHRGVIVKETDSFAQVFHPVKTPGVFDVEPATAEWFPKDGKLLKIELS